MNTLHEANRVMTTTYKVRSPNYPETFDTKKSEKKDTDTLKQNAKGKFHSLQGMISYGET